MREVSGLHYRPDIDGLRALAIVPVLLFHAGLAMPGGYVGVDVFFVISGFLITRLIYRDVTAGTFSYRRFYERRIRRLLPALLLMLAVVTVAATVRLAWFDLRDYGLSLASVVVYISNFYFYRDTGYFAEAAGLKPLLHTWSLGVEEQFYLLAPAALALLVRLTPRRAHAAMLMLGCLASFVGCVWLTAHSSTAAFYLLPPRAWELGLGAVLALLHKGAPKRRWSAEVLCWGGLVAILGSCLTFTLATPYPGWPTALPVLGTLALLAAGEKPGSTARRLLVAPPMVFVGRISYALYLWHWPLIVLANYGHEEASLARSLAALAVSCGLAVLSWALLENPVHTREMLSRPRRLIAAAAAASLALLGVAALLVATDGLPQRSRDFAALEPLIVRDWSHERRECHNLPLSLAINGDYCLRGRAGLPPTFALVGDSHADALSPAVFAAADRFGIAGVQVTASAFLPTPPRAAQGIKWQRMRTAAFLHWLRAHPHVHTVILAQFWQFDATGRSYRRQDWAQIGDGYDSTGMSHDPETLEHELTQLVRAFPDRGFVLLDDVPVGLELDLREYVRSRAYRRPIGTIGLPRTEAERQRAEYQQVLTRLARSNPNVRYRPFLVESLCRTRLCPLFAPDGQPNYRNGDHLSGPGALAITDDLARVLRPVLETRLAQPQQPGR